MMLRGLIAVASGLMVLALALATLLPGNEPLSQVFADLDPSFLVRLQGFELRHFGVWLWQGITVPLLLRPAWLLPFGLGLIAGGGATTLLWRLQEAPLRRR